MSVEITFEPVGLSGLVAEGSFLSDAARRMGCALSLDCQGRGECTSCQVRIDAGASLLSAPTNAETSVLGEDSLARQQRLACQVRIESSGELVVYFDQEKPKAEKEPNPTAGVRKQFSALALDKKISALLQLEVLTMFEALNTAVEKPLALGEKLLERFYRRTKVAQQKARSSKPPPEHHE